MARSWSQVASVQLVEVCMPLLVTGVLCAQAATQGGAVLVTLVTNQALYYFSFYTNPYERWGQPALPCMWAAGMLHTRPAEA